MNALVEVLLFLKEHRVGVAGRVRIGRSDLLLLEGNHVGNQKAAQALEHRLQFKGEQGALAVDQRLIAGRGEPRPHEGFIQRNVRENRVDARDRRAEARSGLREDAAERLIDRLDRRVGLSPDDDRVSQEREQPRRLDLLDLRQKRVVAVGNGKRRQFLRELREDLAVALHRATGKRRERRRARGAHRAGSLVDRGREALGVGAGLLRFCPLLFLVNRERLGNRVSEIVDFPAGIAGVEHRLDAVESLFEIGPLGFPMPAPRRKQGEDGRCVRVGNRILGHPGDGRDQHAGEFDGHGVQLPLSVANLG